MHVNRFALKYDPTTLAVEYTSQGSVFHKKIRIKNIARLNKTKLVDKLISKYADILGPQNVERRQLVDLIDKLAAGAPVSTAPPPSSSSSSHTKMTEQASGTDIDLPTSTAMPAATHVFSSSTLVFGRGTGTGKAPESTGQSSETDDQFGDLNKASDAEVAAAKAKMDVEFNKKQLKPGDDGFEWDVRMDFEAGGESNDWDEESD